MFLLCVEQCGDSLRNSQIYFQPSLVGVVKSKLHLFSILFFLLYIRLENCRFFLCLCEYFTELWMTWIKLGSEIIPFFPCSWIYPDGRGVSERNNLLMCFVSFDVTEQKNPYQMMTKGGRCSTGAGFICNRLQRILLPDVHPSFPPPKSHQYHQSREKEKKKRREEISHRAQYWWVPPPH